MNAIRRRLQPAAWLAILALLALALLPTLSHALAHGRGERSALAEICTPQGMKQLAPGLEAAGGAVEPAGLLSHLDHCPYCALGAGAPMLPPAAAASLALLPLAQAAPALFLHAPRTLFAWATAQPRGPPAHS